jgi:hypothetical protein
LAGAASAAIGCISPKPSTTPALLISEAIIIETNRIAYPRNYAKPVNPKSSQTTIFVQRPRQTSTTIAAQTTALCDCAQLLLTLDRVALTFSFTGASFLLPLPLSRQSTASEIRISSSPKGAYNTTTNRDISINHHDVSHLRELLVSSSLPGCSVQFQHGLEAHKSR